jgi:hypothetical protein
VLQQGLLLGLSGKGTANFRDSKIFLEKSLVDSRKLLIFAPGTLKRNGQR